MPSLVGSVAEKSKGVVLTTNLIARYWFNSHLGHVPASLDKALYDDYLCLVASDKQQIYIEVKCSTPKLVRTIRPKKKAPPSLPCGWKKKIHESNLR